jgi:hypothetical protein
MKIKFSARATLIDELNATITDPVRLSQLNGVTHKEVFSDYLVDDPTTHGLPARGVSGGHLRLRFHNEALWVETEYDLREALTPDEVDALSKYTAGQWSDGIGENFSQTYASEHGLFVSINTRFPAVEFG